MKKIFAALITLGIIVLISLGLIVFIKPNQNTFEVELTLDKTSYLVGEEITANVSIKNNSIGFYRSELESDVYLLSAIKSSIAYYYTDLSLFTSIMPFQSMSEEVTFQLSQIGAYNITVTGSISVDGVRIIFEEVVQINII